MISGEQRAGGRQGPRHWQGEVHRTGSVDKLTCTVSTASRSKASTTDLVLESESVSSTCWPDRLPSRGSGDSNEWRESCVGSSSVSPKATRSLFLPLMANPGRRTDG